MKFTLWHRQFWLHSKCFVFLLSYFRVNTLGGTTSFWRYSPSDTSSQQSQSFYCHFWWRMKSWCQLFHLVTTALLSANWIVTALWKGDTWHPVWLTCVAAIYLLPQQIHSQWKLVQFHLLKGRGLLLCLMHWALGAARGLKKKERGWVEEVYPCILIASYKKLILLDIRETHF